MTSYEWNNNLSVNIDEIDNQHKQLIAVLNAANQAYYKGKIEESIEKIISFLDDYVHKHFKYEEDLLLKYHYPAYTYHKELHDNFKKKIVDYKKRLKSDDHIFLLNDIINSILDWIINHIKGIDTKYSVYLNSKGIY